MNETFDRRARAAAAALLDDATAAQPPAVEALVRRADRRRRRRLVGLSTAAGVLAVTALLIGVATRHAAPNVATVGSGTGGSAASAVPGDDLRLVPRIVPADLPLTAVEARPASATTVDSRVTYLADPPDQFGKSRRWVAVRVMRDAVTGLDQPSTTAPNSIGSVSRADGTTAILRFGGLTPDEQRTVADAIRTAQVVDERLVIDPAALPVGMKSLYQGPVDATGMARSTDGGTLGGTSLVYGTTAITAPPDLTPDGTRPCALIVRVTPAGPELVTAWVAMATGTTSTITVAGHAATLVTDGNSQTTLIWTQAGHVVAVTGNGLSVREVTSAAETLEPVDDTAWNTLADHTQWPPLTTPGAITVGRGELATREKWIASAVPDPNGGFGVCLVFPLVGGCTSPALATVSPQNGALANLFVDDTLLVVAAVPDTTAGAQLVALAPDGHELSRTALDKSPNAGTIKLAAVVIEHATSGNTVELLDSEAHVLSSFVVPPGPGPQPATSTSAAAAATSVFRTVPTNCADSPDCTTATSSTTTSPG